MTRKDIERIHYLADDIKVSKTSSIPFPCPISRVEGWSDENEKTHPKELTYSIFDDDIIVGASILKKIDYKIKCAELAYWIGSSYWGNGIATKASALLRDYAFKELGMEKLVAHALQKGNPASSHILLKLGFSLDESREALDVEGRFSESFPGDQWVFYKLDRSEANT
ncbi:MAG: GNAT family N-acetyltransferase [Cyanobacteria bacterium P01_F01_bin.143]